MIPKIIHYCWFGSKPMPELESRCVAGWRELLPDWKFMLWNEDTFDLDLVPYAREAHDKGKYAFVSDVARIYALCKYGGIYLDTDIELLAPLDSFLNDKAFCGYENRTNIGTAVIGSVPNFPIFKRMFAYYCDNHFDLGDGRFDETTNVRILGEILDSSGYKRINEDNVFEGLHIYNREVFFPKVENGENQTISPYAVAIHHGSASWLTEREIRRGNSLLWRNFARPFLRRCRSLLIHIFGTELTRSVEISLREKIR